MTVPEAKVCLSGVARVDRKTKALVKRLRPNEIAVIFHQDLDEVSAEALLQARVQCVVNGADSMTGRYPNRGPQLLVENGVHLVDCAGEAILEAIRDGEVVEVRDGEVYCRGRLVGCGRVLDRAEIERRLVRGRENLRHELDKFVENTLEYAKKEKDLILGELKLPELPLSLKGRHVLLVVRGADYREDLNAIRPYVEEVRPVLIGVDGGADALREFGWTPDLIVGDMDSVSDETLRCGATLVVHAYPDGRAPGLARLEKLGLSGLILPAPGTSEDVALLLAYEKGAALIVAVGTHSNMIDFLEKGRAGMASTFLVRLKVGSILVDAKGVNRLYRGRLRASYFLQIVLAAFIPVLLIAVLSTPIRQLVQLFLMRLKITLGW
ncbi:MAG: putative cytokinetic ring protein SteA [Bacillota bacterium]|nr:putative cytokinetic ring protein SteA [Bacillota bacterium]